MDLAKSFIGNLTKNLVPGEYNYMISIETVPIFNNSHVTRDQARAVTPSRAIVHGIYNETELYGPYIVEVLSWV
jgi:hypothetical protein